MDYSTLTRTADLIEDGRVRGVKNAHWCSAAKVISPHISRPPVAGLDLAAKAAAVTATTMSARRETT
jgi:hypothetical protein